MSAEVTTLRATDTRLFSSVSTPVPGPDDDPLSGGAQRTVTLLHGFAQNSACLGPLADALAEQGRAVLLDAPGHGASARHANVDLQRGADLVSRTMPAGVLVGYSMGGRLALRTALDHPEKVRALVLIGSTAGIESDHEREARRRSDLALADRLESIGLDMFLEEWLALPMFSALADWARFDSQRRANRADALAASLRNAGTGSMEPVWDRLDQLSMPVLCITGSLDERYSAIAEQMTARIGPHASHVRITGAGHAVHLEAPAAAIEAVVELVDRVGNVG